VLLDNVDDHMPLLRRSHRDAGLMVLLAPDVPAVLLEMGFITNKSDEAALSSPAKRGELMAAVAKSIDLYFEREAKANRL
jgi:N-acetylmuramoyl-L-alanine amidase